MYERFSDRARKVTQLANQEAQRRNHEYVGTEHILMGLVKEGSGVASVVLKKLDIDFCKVRLEVDKLIQDGPPMITQGKLPQTPRAKKVFEYAIDEAKKLGHNYVGTEHILLGLLRENEGIAAQVLINLGVELDNVRKEVTNILGFAEGQTDGQPCTSHSTGTWASCCYSYSADHIIGEFNEKTKLVDPYRLLKKIKPLLQQIVDAMEEEGL